MVWVWRYAYPPSIWLIVNGGVLIALGLGLGPGWLRPALLAVGGLVCLVYLVRQLLYLVAYARTRRRRKRKRKATSE